MVLSIYDLNILADLATLIASCVIFVKWKNLNYKMAWSFLLFGLTGIISAAFSFYQLSGDIHFFMRSLLIIARMVFLTYGISEMIKGAKPLFYSYLLFVMVLFAYIIDPEMSRIYTATGLLVSVVNTTFFVFLFMLKGKEIRLLAFIGIAAMLLSGLFAIMLGTFDTPQPFYIPRLLLALVFIGFAHLSVHAPNHMYNVKRRRRR